MWQRALVVAFFLFVISVMLMMSSSSKMRRTSEATSPFSPVVVDAIPAGAEGAQIRLLRTQAIHAMRALIAEHLHTTFSERRELRVSDRKSAGTLPRE